MYHFRKLSNFRPSFHSNLLSRVNERSSSILQMSRKPSSDLACFKKTLARSKRVVVLTGAGVSAESGVPTFRGSGGFWRTYQAQNLATPGAFRKSPSLVWEFYHYRRELVRTKEPNQAHLAIAKLEEKLWKKDGSLVVITQNIDELHQRAGTKNILELHGSLFKTRCLKCNAVQTNYDSPIVEILRDKGAPDPNAEDARIPEADLPHCKEAGCDGLLRPHVVWFGESLDSDVLNRAEIELAACDLCLVVGTSAVVYPAAMFAPQVAARGVPVAEFNIETTPNTSSFGAPDPNAEDARIPEADLPHCKEAGCDGLLRPHVVWFGESLDSDVLNRAEIELAACDLCLVVGTSAVVYPAAMFAPQVAARGVPVAEFNIETTPNTSSFGYYFEGPCGEYLPKALDI